MSADGFTPRSRSFTLAPMSDKTLSVRLKPEAYGDLEERARAEGRTLAGYTRARLFDDDIRQLIKEMNERLASLEALLRRTK